MQSAKSWKTTLKLYQNITAENSTIIDCFNFSLSKSAESGIIDYFIFSLSKIDIINIH